MVDIDADSWTFLEQEAAAQRRTLDNEISLRLLRSMAPPVQEHIQAATRQPAIVVEPEPSAPSAEVEQELVRLKAAGFVVDNGTGGYVGVYRHGRRWRAMVTYSGNQRRTVGSFVHAEEAAVARARVLESDERQMEEELLKIEKRDGAILRPALALHPAYEKWLHVDCMADGVMKLPPCPFEPGVRYTVDPETLAVTRDSDGVEVVPPFKYVRKGLPS